MSGEGSIGRPDGQLRIPDEDLGIKIKPESPETETSEKPEVSFVPEIVPEKTSQEETEINQRLETFFHTKFKLLGSGNFVDQISQLNQYRESYGNKGQGINILEDGLFRVFIEKFPSFKERDQLRRGLESELKRIEAEKKEAEAKHDREDRAGVVYDSTYVQKAKYAQELEKALTYVVYESEEILEKKAKHLEQLKEEALKEFENQYHLLSIGKNTSEMTLKQASMIVFREWKIQSARYENEKEELLDYLYKYMKNEIKLLVVALNDKVIESKKRLQELQELQESAADEYELNRVEREYEEQNDFVHFLSKILKVEII